MNSSILVVGVIVLVLSVAGYSYSQQQQGLAERAQDALEGNTMDWGVVQTLSLAGIVLGGIVTLVGLLPSEMYKDVS